MLVHQFDELPVTRGRASRLIGALENVHDVFAGRTAVTAAVRDKENVALAQKNRRQIRQPAGTTLAAVVPENGGKRAFALRFVKEAVKSEAAA